MYVMKTSGDRRFSHDGQITPYGNIEISPSAGVFNYGQESRKGSLYLRPSLFGSGSVLGIGPGPEYSFIIFASPIGNWYKNGSSAMSLLIQNKVARASLGGTGGIKSITNYAPVFEVVQKAKAQGFADVLFLDAATGKNIEEVSSCNIFIVKGNLISTPALQGTILPGITRRSVIEIALDFGYQVEERDVPVKEVLDVDEVFCTGTAVGITPVASITYQDKKVEYETGEETVSNKSRVNLTGIQTDAMEDKMGWTVKIDQVFPTIDLVCSQVNKACGTCTFEQIFNHPNANQTRVCILTKSCIMIYI
ncbi:hypothetical protein FNV43_RR19264 [Rhamnella rubrinervis]|uniref:Branched-chain-amino-acid aminotransferase n=1 Tax=Rhamnella rubrinervis TaxID=2594499 RepID=A0A8K0E5D1_9ROSA|nr:hypothetical protein FNV43_RR19264 [Rhamnella rubrinervis]